MAFRQMSECRHFRELSVQVQTGLAVHRFSWMHKWREEMLKKKTTKKPHNLAVDWTMDFPANDFEPLIL